MKILCVIDNLNAGGAQRQLVHIAVGLKSRGHDVEFFTYYPHGHFRPVLDRAAIPVVLHEKSSRFDLSPVLALRRHIKRSGHDAVLAFLETPAFYAELAGWARRNWTLVVGERCADPGMLRGWRRWLRWPHRFADAVVTNSHSNREMLEQHWPQLRPKLSTIYNAVDLDRFSPDAQPAPNGGAPVRMIVVASFIARKNMLGFARGLRHFFDSGGSNLVVDWYGETPTDPTALIEARAYIEEHELGDRLRYHAATQNIEEAYRASDVVGLFSAYEGVPNVVCEAMACGKPVILSDVCDARYLVEDGVTGILCDPESPESIAQALTRFTQLSAADRAAMGDAAREKAELLFEPTRVIDGYEQIIVNGRDAS